MRSSITAVLAFLLSIPVLGADASLPAVDTLVHTSLAPVDEIAVASSIDVDLAVWTSAKHLYAARVGRDGTLLDGTPLDLSTNAFYPSVASDGSRFVVMWATGDPLKTPLAFEAAVVGTDGKPGQASTLVTNANFWSRPRIAFGAGRFAFAWIDDTPFNAASGTHPQGRLSFVTTSADSVSADTWPFAIGVEQEVYVDFAGTRTTYATYVPPTVVPTAAGVEAMWYDATLHSPPVCGLIGCSDPLWDLDVRHSIIKNDGSAYTVAATSASLLRTNSANVTSIVVPEPLFVRSATKSFLLWVTDENLPVVPGGDTVRLLEADTGSLLVPGSGEVIFSSQTGAFTAPDAASTDGSLWAGWIDRMRDREPPQPPQLQLEQISASGEKSAFPSTKSLTRFAMSATRNRVAVASFVPDGWGGKVMLETITEPGPSRARPVRR